MQMCRDSGRNRSYGLPLRSLPSAVTSPSKGRWCSLSKYRCSSPKYRHITYLVVGSWAFSTSAPAGSYVLAQYLDDIRALVAAAEPHKEDQRNNTTNLDESNPESFEEAHHQDGHAAVVDGEHLVLKSLTNESLPYFIESILLCAIASLHRAAPNKSRLQGSEDHNPFMDYCQAIHVLETCLQVFVVAESYGFNLPVKTTLLLLRGGAFAAQTVKAIITKAISWRAELSVSDSTGSLAHLTVLFGAALSLSTTMEEVQMDFQERVALKMQQNGGKRNRGGWASELLAKTYGKKYNTRRSISKTEAKLLPFFSHRIQELQDFLQDQSEVNTIALDEARNDWNTIDIWSGFEHRNIMLSDDKLVSACRTLQAKELTATVLKDWRPAIDNDADDSDYDEDDGSEDLDEDTLSEEEDDDDGDGGFAVQSFARDSTGSRKKPAEELQDNEELGFPTIVVNFKRQKKSH